MIESLPIFELRQVQLQFDRVSALDQINLKIYPGERVGLIGSSGAGKSSLIALLNGTILPTLGQVRVFDRNLADLSPGQLRRIQQQIGTIYQRLHLVESLQVVHNVNAGNLGRWSFWQAAWSLLFPLNLHTTVKALEQVKIADKLYTSCDCLSGGQQQRVAIARVLVQDPVAILADEPISSLDPRLSREIMDLLQNISINTGKTLVLSLHSIEFARSHCDRLIGLRQGKIWFDSPSSAVSDQMLEELYN